MIALTGSEMKQLDANTILDGEFTGIELMSNAANAVYEVIKVEMDNEPQVDKHTIFIACGPGNNGGDGFALGHILALNGYDVVIYYSGAIENLADASNHFYHMINSSLPRPITLISTIEKAIAYISKATILIDALFGISCNRLIDGDYAILIDMMNKSEQSIISIDMPSGIHADHGQVLGIAIKAYKTVTFTLPKVGMILYPGALYTGEIIIKDIGISEKRIQEIDYEYDIIDDSYLKLVPKRRMVSHKGTYGKIAIIAGSRDMAGAAILSAKAAYRSGCGLVRIITQVGNETAIFSTIPEAVISTYRKDTQYFKEDMAHIKKRLQEADAILIGPGLTTDEYATQLVELALAIDDQKIVIDADALNIIANNLALLENRTADIIVTPHIGEMSRLTGYKGHDILNNTVEFAKAFNNRYHVVTVLKSARTIIVVKGKVFINILGHSGMATAGSGDTLAGIIVSLLGQGCSTSLASVLGVYVHSKASHAILEHTNVYSMMASDIIEGLNYVL